MFILASTESGHSLVGPDFTERPSTVAAQTPAQEFWVRGVHVPSVAQLSTATAVGRIAGR